MPKVLASLLLWLMMICCVSRADDQALVAHYAFDEGAGTAAPAGDAAQPGVPAAYPTLRCAGIMWPIDGDLNGNATGTVRYRRNGETAWRPGHPLHRKSPVDVDVGRSMAGRRKITFLGGLSKWDDVKLGYARKHWGANYLAGSVFNLVPGTTYQMLLALHDPDGDEQIERILEVTTRALPLLDGGGRKIHVRSATDKPGFEEAVNEARPGDVVVLHPGVYQGPLIINASGQPGRPIVIRAAGTGAAIIRGEGYRNENTAALQLNGSNLHLHGIAIEEADIGVKIGDWPDYGHSNWEFHKRRADIPANVAITRCRISRVLNAITGSANDCYIADNELSGLAGSNDVHPHSGEGVEVAGQGNVICHNRMRAFADGVSVYFYSSDQDVHSNDVSAGSDDGIELDHCDYNIRVWNNTFFFSGNNGISFQPHIGGPSYIFRNQVMGFRENVIKDCYGASDMYFYHNTFVARQPRPDAEKSLGIAPTNLPMWAVGRNNLYVTAGCTDCPALNVHAQELELNGTIDLDYEGFGSRMIRSDSRGGKQIPLSTYPGSRVVESIGLLIPFESVARVSDALAHAIFIDPSIVFEAPLPPYRDWREDGPALRLRLAKGTHAIDAGTEIPNISGAFAGDAPDLGALEFGLAEPVYGPRPAGSAPYEAVREMK